jgi:hypothetical protein
LVIFLRLQDVVVSCAVFFSSEGAYSLKVLNFPLYFSVLLIVKEMFYVTDTGTRINQDSSLADCMVQCCYRTKSTSRN